jgi:alkanesulfonate monooxygenase SsuD/methylene tetrahydromethanopterin reductase-like flavin-dependent oxidoreductase (luciferase family)
LGTAFAVAFARNPMTVATVANDLQAFSSGRFIFGLGSQIKVAHPASVQYAVGRSRRGRSSHRHRLSPRKTAIRPAWPPADCLVGLDTLGLEPDTLALFLGGNAQRVFRLSVS